MSAHGVLTNTSSSNVTVHGNFIESVGSNGPNLDHGVYFQTSGRITRNVFKDIRCGYGIHLYSAPHDVIVAENTSVGSRTRSSIVVDTTDGNIAVVNNIFAQNATYGIYYVACASSPRRGTGRR
jgi:nitrous oxidase accessory protein NosD